MRLRSSNKRTGTAIKSSPPSSSNGESTSQGVSSYAASASKPEQDNVSDISSSQRKTRGRTMCKDILSISDPDKRIKLELNKYNQPVGETATKLSSACGVVARMSTLCPITYNDWRHLLKDMKEPIISYIKERFILSSDTEEAFALKTIGHAWSTYKSRLRQSIYKADGKGQSKSEIHSSVPYGVEVPQWIQFVDYWLTEEAIEISNKHKEIRGRHTQLHTTGSKSYARKRKEMEDARDREVGAVEFYRETHVKKNGQMDDDAWDVWHQCNALLSGRASSPDNGDSISSSDYIHLENEVMLKVCGVEHSGRVRGAVRGPTPSTWSDCKTPASREVQCLEAKIGSLIKCNAELKKREVELVKREAELEKREAELETREDEREKREAELEKREAELEKHEAEREKRDAERNVELHKLKQMLENFMHR